MSSNDTINRTKNLKLSHYTPRRRLGERRYNSYSFSTSALDGGEWSASRLGRALAPGKEPPGNHWTRSWVGPRAGLDTEARGKILCLCRALNLDRPVVQPVARHYTDWATRLTLSTKHHLNKQRPRKQDSSNKVCLCRRPNSFRPQPNAHHDVWTGHTSTARPQATHGEAHWGLRFEWVRPRDLVQRLPREKSHSCHALCSSHPISLLPSVFLPCGLKRALTTTGSQLPTTPYWHRHNQ
jgi:hypothetical protein